MHVTLVPFIDTAGELKTKPTQHSVNELRRIGVHPDIIVARSRDPISADIREKIALFADLEPSAVIANHDVDDLYLVPSALQAEGFDALVCDKLRLPEGEAQLGEWLELTERIRAPRAGDVEIALVGKYVKLRDAYLSVHEALKHAGVHHGCSVHVRWFDAEGMSLEEAQAELESVDGVLVPGGFGSRGWEGKILACRVAREHGIPYLGICLGMHVAVSEYARHVVGLEGANSTEMDPETPFPVIDLLPEQKEIEDLGGTMRLGAQAVELAEGTRALDRLQRARDQRAAPASLRGEQPLPAAARGRRARRVRNVSGRAAGRDRRAPRPPVVRREPVPPGVQVAADTASAVVPRLRRRRLRALTRACDQCCRCVLAVGPEHGDVVRQARDPRLARPVAQAAPRAVLANDGRAAHQLSGRDHRLELPLGLRRAGDVGHTQLQELVPRVAEQLRRRRVGGDVPHLLVGDEDRYRRMLDGLAEEDCLYERLRRAHTMNLTRASTIA